MLVGGGLLGDLEDKDEVFFSLSEFFSYVEGVRCFLCVEK